MDKIELMREIVNGHSYKEIEGTIIDVQTANLIIKVYEGLRSELKDHFTSQSIIKMADISWKVYAKQQARA
ncbi:hypothetical protein [Oceanobacillus sp. FSL H7-0719]|uniref:hypothetical protein n=1 Tax=Oceanobacillus sp. FSL H7-0719 TaxID=2954507 RepID=UPI003255EB75